MNTVTKNIVVASLYAATFFLGSVAEAEETIKIGVSVPSADHGWTGGIDFFAQETKKRLESTYKNIQVIVKTATGPSDQANSLEDLVATQQINALVILPYESAPLTDPVREVKKKGIFVTIVKCDRVNRPSLYRKTSGERHLHPRFPAGNPRQCKSVLLP